MSNAFTSMNTCMTVTGQWAKPMSPAQVDKLAKAVGPADRARDIQSTVTAKINDTMVHANSFDPDKPFAKTWTIFGNTDSDWPQGHSPEIFEKVASDFRDAGYEASFGPSKKYGQPDSPAYDLVIREPIDD